MKSPLPNNQARATWPGFAPIVLGDVPHDLDRIHVGVEILAMEAGIVLAGVLRCIFLRTPDVTRQEPSAKWAEGNKTNPEFPQHGDDLAFKVSLPQGIFAL